MAIALAQTPVSNTNAPVTSLATGPTGSSTTAGNSLLVLVRLGLNTNDVSSLSDTQGNTYARIVDYAQSTGVTSRFIMFVASNIVGGAATTVTLNFNTSVSASARLYEISGLVASNATVLDVATPGDTSTGTVITSSNLSLSYSEELVIAIGYNKSSVTITAGTGYGDFLQTSISAERTAFEDKIVTGGGAVNASVNFASSVAGNILVAALKGSSATLVGAPVNFIKVPTIMVMR
jgi:hypothetical protein